MVKLSPQQNQVQQRCSQPRTRLFFTDINKWRQWKKRTELKSTLTTWKGMSGGKDHEKKKRRRVGQCKGWAHKVKKTQMRKETTANRMKFDFWKLKQDCERDVTRSKVRNIERLHCLDIFTQVRPYCNSDHEAITCVTSIKSTVSKATMYRWIAKQDLMSYTPRLSPIHDVSFQLAARQFVDAHCLQKGVKNMRVQDFVVWVNCTLKGQGHTISAETARLWLHSLGFQWRRVAAQTFSDAHERADVVEYREEYLAKLAQYDADGYDRIYHDEASFHSNDEELYAWGDPKRPKVWTSPKGNGPSIMIGDFVSERAGLFSTRMLETRKEGYYDSPKFLADVKAALKKYKGRRSAVWIFDNSPVHLKKSTAQRSAGRTELEMLFVRSRHHTLLLPKCHPELNPIERVWAKAKQHIRVKCRHSIVALRQAIADEYHAIATPDFIHKIFAKVRRFETCYRRGASFFQVGKLAAQMKRLQEKKKSHRRSPVS